MRQPAQEETNVELSTIIEALIASSAKPYPYSWRDGSDKAWRNLVRHLGVASRFGVSDDEADYKRW